MTVKIIYKKMKGWKSMFFSFLRRIMRWCLSLAFRKISFWFVGKRWILRFACVIFLSFFLILLLLAFRGMTALILRPRLPWMSNQSRFFLFTFRFLVSISRGTFRLLSFFTFSFAWWTRRPSSFPLIRFWSRCFTLTWTSFGCSFLNTYSFRMRLSHILLPLLNSCSHSTLPFDLTINFFRLNFALRFISYIVMSFFESFSHSFSSFDGRFLFLCFFFCLFFFRFLFKSFFLVADTRGVFFTFRRRLLSFWFISTIILLFGGRVVFPGWFAGRPFLLGSLIKALRIAVFEILVEIDYFRNGS